uniref:Uncharacterized protein n=1 Tax=Dulem virus 71 TaxID=3145782 RepID=A0AAU8AXG7_9VIRU
MMINIFTPKDVEEYSSLNKIYIPNDYNNSSYSYFLNDNFITINTNDECRTQYNTTYCTCFSYYYDNNIISDSYECSSSSNSRLIPYESITSDINYNTNIKNQYYSNTIIFLLMLILGIIFALFLTKERSSY